MRKLKIFSVLAICLVGLFCSCGKKTESSADKEYHDTIETGKYYLNNIQEENSPYISIEENNMLELVNFEYEELTEGMKKEFSDYEIKDDAADRMREPYSYTNGSKENQFSVMLFDNTGIGFILYYNKEDQIITFLKEDYYLENQND